MSVKSPRIVIAGVSSGVGKTSISLGIKRKKDYELAKRETTRQLITRRGGCNQYDHEPVDTSVVFAEGVCNC